MASKNSGEQRSFRASSPGPKKNKGYRWVSPALLGRYWNQKGGASLVLVLVFLGAGGFVAWFLMKNAAHNLAATNYMRLSDRSYSTARKAEQEEGFFASEEGLAKAELSLKRELLEPSSATGQAGRGTTRTSASASGGVAGAGGAAGEDGSATGTVGRGVAAHGSGLEARLGASERVLRAKGAPPSKPAHWTRRRARTR